MLSVRGLSRKFGSTVALDGISFDVEPGTFVVVIGRSGAGKSTLLRCLNRLIEPTSGTISVDGREIRHLAGRDLREWRASAAMIFQGFNLAPRLDVLTNVLVGASLEVPLARRLLRLHGTAERLRAARILDDLGLLDKALERAERLSGGQQQRVAIARALMQNPRLILADEPIASLDPRSARTVMETLRRINGEKGIPILCNLHSLDVARTYGDRVIALRDGKLVMNGPIAALTDDMVREVYGSDADEAGLSAAPEPISLPDVNPTGPAIAALQPA